MAYLDRNNNKHRTTTIIAVTVVEAAAIYAVVMGLDIPVVFRDPIPNPQGEIIKLTPQPVPSPSPNPSPSPSLQPDRPTDTTRDDFDFNRGSTIADFSPQPVPSPSPTQDSIDLRPDLAPRFTPAAPLPLGSPAGWVTSNDYPARDLREGNQGRVSFSLEVGSDGRVKNCSVTRSSGFAGLDAAACDAITRRARFKPATDGSGEKVSGSYANSIRWVIPE